MRGPAPWMLPMDGVGAGPENGSKGCCVLWTPRAHGRGKLKEHFI